MSHELGGAFTELLARIRTERQRQGAPPTLRVGGFARLGSQLERTLRAALAHAADEAGTTDQALLDAVAPGLQVGRATAGQLAVALKRFPRERATDNALRVLLDDLKAPRSAIQECIEARNRAAHEGVLPSSDDALANLAVLLERAAGASR